MKPAGVASIRQQGFDHAGSVIGPLHLRQRLSKHIDGSDELRHARGHELIASHA